MGRKRHAMVDTDGRALGFLVHPADVQDRDGTVPLLKQSQRWHPFVKHAFAWINRGRCLARNFEKTIPSATAFLYAAAAIVLIRRIARYA